MPAEDTTTQVAPASDPADTGVAQAEQTQATQGAAAGANGETTPEPDIKAEWEKTKAELAQERASKLAAEKRAEDAEHLVRTQAGTQSASDRRMNRLEQQLLRQGQIIEAGLTTPDASAAIAKLKTDHQGEDQASFSSFIAEQGRNNDAALQAAGFTDADINNEELSDGLAIWDAAFRAGDRDGIERAVKSLARGIKRMQAAKEAAKPAATPAKPEPVAVGAAANGTGRRIPNLSAGDGIGPGAESLQALVNRLASGKPMSDAEIARAQDAMENKGIYPG